MDLNCDNRFAWNAPTVADVKPFRGSIFGGDEINIGGFNFGLYNRDIKEVIIRGVVCTNPKVLSSNLIQCYSGRSRMMGVGFGTVVLILTNGLSSPKHVCNYFEYFEIIQKKTVLAKKPPAVIKPPNCIDKKPKPKQKCIFKDGKPCCMCKPIPGVNYKPAMLVPILHKYDHLRTDDNESSNQLLFDMPKVGLRKNRFKTDVEEELTEENQKIYKHIIETEKLKKKPIIELSDGLS